ncbi:MAG: hypothetical protein H0W60_00810 [Chloroflexi bacterium]|jgi:hypothetical protein|nr:hypothetical protein [Chloroflexota bacterium]
MAHQSPAPDLPESQRADQSDDPSLPHGSRPEDDDPKVTAGSPKPWLLIALVVLAVFVVAFVGAIIWGVVRLA